MKIYDPNKQPEPIKIPIPLMGTDAVIQIFESDECKIMYSMMDTGTLMKLREYLDALIKWKVQGNPVSIGTLTYIITEKKS